MPALLAPTEKLCEGAAPNDRLRVRPPGWVLAGEGPYWKLDVEEEAVRGEEGTLRDEKESAMKYTGQKSQYNGLLQPWRMDRLSSDGV